MGPTLLNVVSLKQFDSPHTYVFAYDDSEESFQQLDLLAQLWIISPDLDFSPALYEALHRGIENNQRAKERDSQERGEIAECCDDLIDRLFSTPFGGVVCLINDLCPLYTIIEVLRSLLIEEGILYRIETLSHVMIKLPSGIVKHAYFVREQESEGLPLEDWPIFDMTGLGEINEG